MGWKLIFFFSFGNRTAPTHSIERDEGHPHNFDELRAPEKIKDMKLNCRSARFNKLTSSCVCVCISMTNFPCQQNDFRSTVTTTFKAPAHTLSNDLKKKIIKINRKKKARHTVRYRISFESQMMPRHAKYARDRLTPNNAKAPSPSPQPPYPFYLPQAVSVYVCPKKKQGTKENN